MTDLMTMISVKFCKRVKQTSELSVAFQFAKGSLVQSRLKWLILDLWY